MAVCTVDTACYHHCSAGAEHISGVKAVFYCAAAQISHDTARIDFISIGRSAADIHMAATVTDGTVAANTAGNAAHVQ